MAIKLSMRECWQCDRTYAQHESDADVTETFCTKECEEAFNAGFATKDDVVKEVYEEARNRDIQTPDVVGSSAAMASSLIDIGQKRTKISFTQDKLDGKD